MTEVYNDEHYHFIRENRLLAFFTTFNLCTLPQHCDFVLKHFKLCTIITIHKVVFFLLDMAYISNL